MNVNTHKNIAHTLCGTPMELTENRARVCLTTNENMAVDKLGLVHGGFIFSLADHAAMLAVNHPNVVLASSTVNFTRPVKVGDALQADAKVNFKEGKKRLVRVTVTGADEQEVFNGEFLCVVLQEHVLEQDRPPRA